MGDHEAQNVIKGLVSFLSSFLHYIDFSTLLPFIHITTSLDKLLRHFPSLLYSLWHKGVSINVKRTKSRQVRRMCYSWRKSFKALAVISNIACLLNSTLYTTKYHIHIFLKKKWTNKLRNRQDLNKASWSY